MKKPHNPFFQNNLFGILMMMLHALALSVLYAVIKDVTKEVNSNVVVFFYKLLILIAIIPWCISGGISDLKTNRIKLHMSRGFLSLGGSLCMFYAIKHIGLSDITAVAYLEQIVLLIIGLVYFKEKATRTKLFVIAASFFGAIFIIKPDYVLWIYYHFLGQEYHFHSQTNGFYAFVFLAIAFWSMNTTVIKVLGKTEKTKVQLFYVMLFSCILAFPVAFMEWNVLTTLGAFEIKYPTQFIDFAAIGLKWKHLGLISVLSICYFLHCIGHFKAFKHAEISVVIPFEYTRLLFAGILGYYFFAEVPQTPSYLGYALITGAGILLLRSEHRKMKKKKLQEQLAEDLQA